MIIDCHAHLSPPLALDKYRQWLIDTKGAEGKGALNISDDDIRDAMNRADNGPFSHLEGMERGGIDVQLLSPRPMHMMHSQKPLEVVKWFAEATNDLVWRHTQIWPEKFIGIAALPEYAGEPVDDAVLELRRCVTELGFRGCILNPDPFENTGPQAPPLWDKYWYPLWETLCELDVPCHIHGAGTKHTREFENHYYIHEEATAGIAFVASPILDDFPSLKVVLSHGGGSLPFQIGRYEALEYKRRQRSFIERMTSIYFDTVIHDIRAVKFLVEVCGEDNCLYGTEYPGLGSVIDPDTGRTRDDQADAIQSAEWLSEVGMKKILGGNADKVFGLNLFNKQQAAE